MSYLYYYLLGCAVYKTPELVHNSMYSVEYNMRPLYCNTKWHVICLFFILPWNKCGHRLVLPEGHVWIAQRADLNIHTYCPKCVWIV